MKGASGVSRPTGLALLLMLVATLSACAAAPTAGGADAASTSSYVAAVEPADAAILAQAIVAYLSDALPPASSTLRLVPPAADPPDPVLTPAVTRGLIQAGYGLSTTDGSDVHPIVYRVTPLDDGLLLRLDIDRTLVSCFYTREGQGALVLAGDCMSLQGTQ